MPRLKGPRLPARGARRPAGLVVLLHGYSMTGHDMMPVARALQASLPDHEFVAPHAHLPLAERGRAWMRLQSLTAAEFWAGAVSARPVLDRFLDAECERLAMAADRVVLLGFSQGAVLALHGGLRRAAGLRAILAYSGLLAGPRHLDEVACRPRVALIHGELDPVVPPRELDAAAAALRGAGIEVSTSLEPGTGHTISAAGVAHGLRAIRAALLDPVADRDHGSA